MGILGSEHEAAANWPCVFLGDNTMAKTPQTGCSKSQWVATEIINWNWVHKTRISKTFNIFISAKWHRHKPSYRRTDDVPTSPRQSQSHWQWHWHCHWHWHWHYHPQMELKPRPRCDFLDFFFDCSSNAIKQALVNCSHVDSFSLPASSIQLSDHHLAGRQSANSVWPSPESRFSANTKTSK